MIHAREDYNRIQDPAVEDHTLLGKGSTPIGVNEPVFLVRAQDKHAYKAVLAYTEAISQDPNVDPKMVAVCATWATEMQLWEGDKKSPDIP